MPEPSLRAGLRVARSSNCCYLLVDGRHEVLATLVPPVLQHLAAAPRGHAGPKAVRARAADVVRLVGALHEGGGKKAPPGPSVKPALGEGPSLGGPDSGAEEISVRVRAQVFDSAGARNGESGLPPTYVAVVPRTERRRMALSNRGQVGHGSPGRLRGDPRGSPVWCAATHFPPSTGSRSPASPDDGAALFRPTTNEQSIVYAQLGLGFVRKPSPHERPSRTRQPWGLRPRSSGLSSRRTCREASEFFDHLTLGFHAAHNVWEQSGSRSRFIRRHLQQRRPHRVRDEPACGGGHAVRHSLRHRSQRGSVPRDRRGARHLRAHGLDDQLRRRRRARRAPDDHGGVDAEALRDARREHRHRRAARQLDQQPRRARRAGGRSRHRQRVALGRLRAAPAERTAGTASGRRSSGRPASPATP